MKISVKAKPKSRQAFIKRIDDTHYIVAVKEPPIGGRANEAIISALSDFFHKPKSQIFIIQGTTSKQKIVEVPLSADEFKILELQKKLFYADN